MDPTTGWQKLSRKNYDWCWGQKLGSESSSAGKEGSIERGVAVGNRPGSVGWGRTKRGISFEEEEKILTGYHYSVQSISVDDVLVTKRTL